MATDKNGRPLSVGDRVFWENGETGATIMGFPSPASRWSNGHRASERVSVKFDDNGAEEDVYGHNLVKITEQDLIDLLEGDKEGIGRKFCERFALKDYQLKNEPCSARAIRRMIDVYADKI